MMEESEWKTFVFRFGVRCILAACCIGVVIFLVRAW